MDMSVVERLRWLQLQQQKLMSEKSNSNDTSASSQLLQMMHSFNHLIPLHGSNSHVGFVHPYTTDGCISRTNSCQTAMNKRKSEIKEGEKHMKKKKIKKESEIESILKGKSNESNDTDQTSSDTTKETSKMSSEIHKLDYIHVRARRGQATDRHSLAERARREKISKKMKCLQDLVPGCDRVTGKAGMLDEIINYVQSLQRQVEFLSMKLTVLNPELEFDIDDLSSNQFQAYFTNLQKPPLMAGLASLQLNQQGSLDLPITNPNQTTSANAASSSLETHSQRPYNGHSLGFHF